MTWESGLASLVGGVLIGLAAWVLLFFNGRIAGVSGVVGRAVVTRGAERDWRFAFLGGLLLGGVLLRVFWPAALGGPVLQNGPLLVLAGLLVGVGTQLGNGCTSGHGVCGLSRRSGRSLVAVMTFMGVAMVTVLVQRLAGGAL